MSSIVEEIVSEARAADAAAREMYIAIVGRAAVDANESTDAKRVRDLLLKLDLSPDDLAADIAAVRAANAESAKLVDPAELSKLREDAAALQREANAERARLETLLAAVDDAATAAMGRSRVADSRQRTAVEAIARIKQSNGRAFGLPTPAK